PLPDDTIAAFRLVARARGDSAVQDVVARIAPRYRPPAGRAAWIDTTSFAPPGTLALPLSEGIRLAVRATPGATVQLRLPWGATLPFLPDPLPGEPAWGVRAFATTTAAYRLPPAADRYVAWLPAAALCSDGKSACATLDVVVGRDSATARWPLTIGLVDMTFPSVVVLNDDTAHTGTTDSMTPGKSVPGGTYNWFFPTGTTAVLSGRWNDQVRVQLSKSSAQPAADEVTITVELARRVWGYRTRFDGRDLLLEVRRPPEIDPHRPLRGRTIVLDPGHPPAGAKGPTGLWEPVATLAVAYNAKALLERAGATVLLTRTDSTPVELFPRTHFAEVHDADVLVSIHANALPDGVNPFVNNGTSVYYFHPRSAPLARALERTSQRGAARMEVVDARAVIRSEEH